MGINWQDTQKFVQAYIRAGDGRRKVPTLTLCPSPSISAYCLQNSLTFPLNRAYYGRFVLNYYPAHCWATKCHSGKKKIMYTVEYEDGTVFAACESYGHMLSRLYYIGDNFYHGEKFIYRPLYE